jgi:hypothetical protein
MFCIMALFPANEIFGLLTAKHLVLVVFIVYVYHLGLIGFKRIVKYFDEL